VIIDFHTHIVSPKVKKNRSKYVESDPCFAVLYSDSKAKLVTADELIDSMDKDEIDLSRYPDRLIGFCTVQPNSYEAAIDEIERCVQGGIKGIGEIRPDMQLFHLLDEEIMAPFIEVTRKHNLTLLTHSSEPVGHDYPGKGIITPSLLYHFITRYPDIIIICAHWGGGLPFYALMPEVKEAMKNVFFDTAASPFLYSPQVYNHVIQLVGNDKILFGSDYPLMAQNRVLNEIQSLNLPETTEKMILSTNAQGLLGIS
jgi:predicted TIM-barrel fold metal-dependent hydrolase